MTRQIRKLYRYWKSENRDTSSVIKSWKQMDSTIIGIVPEEQQEVFTNLLMEHSRKIERQGFITGFRFATAIWKEAMNGTI